MEKCIRESPLTRHFTNIHRIPFGIRNVNVKKQANKRVVIGFRLDNSELKGCQFLFKAIEGLKRYRDLIEFQCVGNGVVSEEMSNNFALTVFGWINDQEKMTSIMAGWDIFVMPSIGESFGLMAIEAMACGCALLCFEGTSVYEISNAPSDALAAKYASEKDLSLKMEQLILDEDMRKEYQKKGRKYVKRKYRFEDYVSSHIELYEKVLGQ